MTREEIIRMARESSLLDAMDCQYPTVEYALERFAALVAAAEREKLAAWMMRFGFATGHGDTMEQLCDALGTEIVDRIECEVETEREACANVCDTEADNPSSLWEEPGCWQHAAENCATTIRARSKA